MDLTAIAAAAASIASTPVTPFAPNALRAADGPAAVRFAEIMQARGAVAPDDLAGPGETLGVTSPKPPSGPPLNIGESILSSLQGVSENMREAHAKIHAMLDPQGGAMTVQQGLALQFQVAVTTMQYDLLGKVVAKSVQNLDQMVKMQ